MMDYNKLYFKKAMVLNWDCTITNFYSYNQNIGLKAVVTVMLFQSLFIVLAHFLSFKRFLEYKV